MYMHPRRPPRLRKLCAALALVAFATAAAAADYKIGFVNTERLFREATPAKRAQASPRGTAARYLRIRSCSRRRPPP